jgi:tRNA pseudouridine13 synthase
MKETPYPLECSLGLGLYSTNTPGIAGVLRRSAEDFQVTEQNHPLGREGPYLICRLTKKDWETQRVVKEIARSLGISHRRIGWAGTKDKRAVTTQQISIYGVEPSDLSRITLRDVMLEVIGRSDEPLSLGKHRGNQFTIWIRECQGDLEELVPACTRELSSGTLNYYGLQRFGVLRPITHRVGEKILQGDFSGAVNVYVGLSFPQEPEATQEARNTFLSTQNPRQALRELPVHLSYERAILHHLTTAPQDPAGALRMLPPKLLSLFVSAYQSYLFNRALTERCDAGASLHAPVVGDHLIFLDGRTDVVTEPHLPAARLQVARGRAKIALQIPGSSREEWATTSSLIREILEEQAITPRSFQEAQEFVGISFRGFHRPILLSTTTHASTEGQDVRLEFFLEPGQYATLICREYMKGDPFSLI